jgi:predicted MFS family arabinose efflux permease
VWTLCGVALIHRSGNFVLPFLTLYLTVERGLSAPQAGLVVGTYGVGSMAGSWLGGWLADRWEPRRAQMWSLILGGAGMLALAPLTDPILLAVGVLVTSSMLEALRPSNLAALVRQAPPALRSRAFALLRLAANIGWGVGPAVGGVIAARDYRLLFVGNALAAWLAAAVLVAFVPRRAAGARPPEPDGAGRAARSPYRDGPFIALLVWTMVLVGTLFQILGAVPLYFREIEGLDERAIGLVLAANGALIVCFEMVLVRWLEQQSRPLLFIGLGAVLLCGGFAVLPLGSGIPFLLFTVALWSLGEMFALPLLNALVAGRAEESRLGSYMGAYTMAFSLAAVIAPAAGTALYEHVGPSAPWYACGLLAAPLLVGLRLIGPRVLSSAGQGGVA